MAALIWGWAFAWLAWRLVLEWRIAREWIPGSYDPDLHLDGGRRPPQAAFSSAGARLWRLRWHVTTWGGLGWCALVVVAVVRAFAH